MAGLDELREQYKRLDTEAGKYNRPEFDEVYKIISELTEGRDDVGDRGNLALPLVTGSVIDEAIRRAGFDGDACFVADFKKYREIEQQAREVQLKMVEATMAERRPEPQQVEGWHFVPVSVFAPIEFHTAINSVIEQDAREGKGLFANVTQIPEEDEDLDAFLMAEPYGLRCSLVPFLDELRRYSVAGSENAFFGREKTRQLFELLKKTAEAMKANTDKPQATRNTIADVIKCFDDVPIWGLFFQILFLQGLCRLLESVNINEGDDGYNEASSLYEWLCLELAKKELVFCYTPYGAEGMEQLKPLCAYLMSTEVGQLVQSIIFGNEPEAAITGTPSETQKRPLKADGGNGRVIVPPDGQNANSGLFVNSEVGDANGEPKGGDAVALPDSLKTVTSITESYGSPGQAPDTERKALGRKPRPFDDLIILQDKETYLQNLHKAIDGKSVDVAMSILSNAIIGGKLLKPSYTEFHKEFPLINIPGRTYRDKLKYAQTPNSDLLTS